MRIRRAAVVFPVAALALVGAARPCLACSCIAASDAEHFRQAEVVFVGIVLERRPIAPEPISSSADPVTWVFDVESVQKGEAAEQQEVVSPRDEASCGFEFQIGRRYQVFASRSDDGRLATNLCTGTRELNPGQEPYTSGPSRPPLQMHGPELPVPTTGAGPIVSPDVQPAQPPAVPATDSSLQAQRSATGDRQDSVIPGVVAAVAALAALGTAAAVTMLRRRSG